MFYGDTVQDTRTMFFESWKKYNQQLPLSSLEKEVVSVILDHPEYHNVLKNSESLSQHTYYPELGQTNPFLHMGLHLAIREQVQTDRPVGIKAIYQQGLIKYKNSIQVEHVMMEVLAESLWLAQKNGLAPDETTYLITLREAIDVNR